MPQITQNENGGVIRWDEQDWQAGLIPQFGVGTTTATNVSGFASATGIDPFRRPGYAYPGVNPNDSTNVSVVDAVIKNGALYGGGSTGLAYLISGGTKLHQFTTSTATLTNDIGSGGNWPHTITPHGHSGAIGSDVAVYHQGTTPYLFYSWYDGTDWDVGRYDLSSTFDDDYMSTVPTTPLADNWGGVDTNDYLTQGQGIPHPMIVGDDNILYIGNGKDLASLNNTTFNGSALDLPNGYVITSFAKLPNFLVIFAYLKTGANSSYKSSSTAFFWNYVDSSFSYAYPLKGNYVNGGFNYKSTVGCFVTGQTSYIGSSKDSKLLLWDGSVFKTVFNFTDDIPGHGGVEAFDDVIMWNSSGKIYEYGSPHIGLVAGTPANIISVLDGTTAEGMLKNFSSSRNMASAGTTTSGGLQNLNGDYYPGSFLTPNIEIPAPQEQKIKITQVKIYWFGTRVTKSNRIGVRINADRSSTSSVIIDESTDNARQTISSDLVDVYKSDSSGNTLISGTCISLEVTYAEATVANRPAIIRAVEVYYKTNVKA